ncbi:hypothetical protein [Pontibacter cellulosilyticus]|uniref:Lipoprotein n=1 Tax=Pontibacter cellulosilyticus TaxID=1720253 RepID=A0A923N4P0_9BACT|nr:hypothetical protein [Pontibacter cellulosilyticus]MBC5992163.1 hypothetical protein [Pontibacter cellulosilyticus]
MKKLLAMVCMVLGCAGAVNASGGTKTTTKKTNKLDKRTMVVAEKRANHLSDKMIVDLGLNNYQSRKIREINNDVVAQKMAVEAEFAGNQAIIDQKCKEICSVRDVKLESILSTRQYNEYFGDRKVYNQTEKEFMASLYQPAGNQTASSDVAAPANSVSLN